MKIALVLMLVFFCPRLLAQDSENPDKPTEESQDLGGPANDEQQKDVLPDEQNRNVANEKCNCPEYAVPEEEVAAPTSSVFPPGAVFNITPAPLPPVQEEQKQPQKEVIPGYTEKLPSGFSDDAYKQIPWD